MPLYTREPIAPRKSIEAHGIVTYPAVASDSELRVTQEWRSIKVFCHDSLYINRGFLLLSFSASLYCMIESTHGSPLSTIATGIPTPVTSENLSMSL